MRTDYIIENILISLLAVNGWTVERVFPLTERFRAAGLLDFSTVSHLPLEEIAVRLASAGYDRGDYMNLLLARRVSSLAASLTHSEVERIKGYLLEGRAADVSSTLERINGVGPVVLETFWTLQSTD